MIGPGVNLVNTNVADTASSTLFTSQKMLTSVAGEVRRLVQQSRSRLVIARRDLHGFMA